MIFWQPTSVEGKQKRGADILVPDAGTQAQQVHHAAEVAFRANGDLQGHDSHAQALFQHGHHAVEVGSHAVELVDEGNAGHAVLVGQAPVGLGLRLHAGHAVEHDDRAVEHAQ